ncbi:MAG TPA: hypothetical protein VLD59_18935 [Steroidobacteraceae bacterium]|nr:hypothetical protein [Steroidobacteraceae bacterium]
MASRPVTKRARPIGAAEIFATIGILVTAVSFMGFMGNRADRSEVQRASVATRSALVVPAADSEREGTGQDANREVDAKAVALTDASR